MGWYAKPSGGWSTEDNEAQQNMFMIAEYLQTQGWSMVAIAGLLGNIGSESGFNPWRWQSDTVNYNRGYGLVQFTPASYYIGGRGVGVTDYSPNLSTSSQTSGSTANDGRAQLYVIEQYHSDKFLDRRSKCDYADISDSYPYASYKTLTDLWVATVGWLFNYEYPASQYRDYEHAHNRYLVAQRCYEIITGQEPPEPPTPPTPPVPPTPTSRTGMPLYFYITKKFKRKKGLI
jgi:hypothetical protein